MVAGPEDLVKNNIDGMKKKGGLLFYYECIVHVVLNIHVCTKV